MGFVRGLIKHCLAITALISSSDTKAQDLTCLTHELRHAFGEQASTIDAIKLNQAFLKGCLFPSNFGSGSIVRGAVPDGGVPPRVCGSDLFRVRDVRFSIWVDETFSPK